MEVEEVNHTFLGFQVAKDMFAFLDKLHDLDLFSLILVTHFHNFVSCAKISTTRRIVLDAIISTWWHLWNFRNKCLFDQVCPKNISLVDVIVATSFCWVIHTKLRFEFMASKSILNPDVICFLL